MREWFRRSNFEEGTNLENRLQRLNQKTRRANQAGRQRPELWRLSLAENRLVPGRQRTGKSILPAELARAEKRVACFAAKAKISSNGVHTRLRLRYGGTECSGEGRAGLPISIKLWDAAGGLAGEEYAIHA